MKSKPVAFLMADLGVTKSQADLMCPTTTRIRKADSERVSGPLRLHLRQRHLLSAVFPVVQRRAPPPAASPYSPRTWFIFGESRAVPAPCQVVLDAAYRDRPKLLRQAIAQTTAATLGGLDQQTRSQRPKDKGRKSLNSHTKCLRVSDTCRALSAPLGFWKECQDETWSLASRTQRRQSGHTTAGWCPI